MTVGNFPAQFAFLFSFVQTLQASQLKVNLHLKKKGSVVTRSVHQSISFIASQPSDSLYDRCLCGTPMTLLQSFENVKNKSLNIA